MNTLMIITTLLMIGYKKYLVYGIGFVFMFFITRYLWKNDPFREWFLKSFEENGKPSSKYISAFVFCIIICICCLVAIDYSQNHVLPDFMFWGILGLITSIWGIREVGRYVTTKYSYGANGNGNSNGNGLPQQSPVPDVQPPAEVKTKEQFLSELTDSQLADELKKRYVASGSGDTFEIWFSKTTTSTQ